MSFLRQALEKILEKKDLTEMEAEGAFLDLSETPTPPVAAAFLTALRVKGESFSELAGAAKSILKKAKPFPEFTRPLVDIVGTGGDGKHTPNVSTLAALTVAAAQIPVAKHGNRAVSSKFGSADLLEYLGIPLDQSADSAAQSLRRFFFAFLFAPYYHSQFSQVAEVRRALGFRTIFNLLGPLTNPAKPQIRLIGVFHPDWMEKMARVLKKLGCKRAWVVHGGGGSDELDLQGENLIVSLENGRLRKRSLSAKDAGLPRRRLTEISSNDSRKNCALAVEALKGKPGALQDVVALNAGAAMFLAGDCRNVGQGVARAKDILTKGQVWRLVETMVQDGNSQ